MPFKRVAVIGGGAAGATLIGELLERRDAPSLHLDWYTGGEHALARGIAYGTGSARHLLNVRAASMSMFAGKPRGFLDYAQAIDPSIGGADFLPRRMYGDYLEAEIERGLHQARAAGHDVRVIPLPVSGLVPNADGVEVLYADEQSRVDAVVLALGSLPPRPVAGVTAAALDSGRYVTDPWPFLAQVSPNDQPRDILVIGLGLTAIDVILELTAQWPNARITAVSRHGLAPEAHPVTASAPADSGAELVESLRDEPTARAWLRHLREATSQADDWRPVIDSLRPHTPALWAELPEEERARFLRHARWAWERARHRMPPQIAEALDTLEAAGRLQHAPSRVRAVEVGTDGKLAVTLWSAKTARESVRQFDWVIQTVGLNTDVLRSNHVLLSQLVTNGHVHADTLGLGLQAAPTGQLIDRTGKPSPRMFAMGTLLRGALWESTAMPEIRQQARALTDRLLTP